jgi:hypothetical protein
MSMTPDAAPHASGPVPVRPANWFPDPLDDSLLRYWDGYRWSFHTTERPPAAPAAPVAFPPQEDAAGSDAGLRADISAAMHRSRGSLLGSMKEIRMLSDHLYPEETVLALAGAAGEGIGVLACTDRRLLFLFAGIIRRQHLEVDWNNAKELYYERSTGNFSVYTKKRTKRAIPIMSVRVPNVHDATAIAQAVEAASAAPRLDVV